MPKHAEFKTVTIGDIKVSFLPDGGGVTNPLVVYPASTEEGWKAHANLLDEDGKLITSIGAYLVEIGDRKIAVDAGIGPVSIEFPGAGTFSGGKYLESLEQTGIVPEEVTDVVFTHLHLDHCGWTTIEADGERKLLYPNARHMVTQAEWDMWYGGEEPAGPHPEYVQKPLEGRIEMIADGDSIAPGMTVIATPGHTFGHISLRLEAGDQRLFITADILHGEMQLVEKDWSIAFDADPELARQSREGLYPELTKPNTISAINHFSDAIFGRLTEVGGKLNWTPI